jgi:glycosyltransferase involved in cell wall biosynthesis
VKLAWVSPLPPSLSGIGDYSADLLPTISQLAPTIAFTSEPEWKPPEPVEDLEVRHYSELEPALQDDPELIPVYHQGNNPYHNFVYDLAVRFPGVLVLHDVVLHHVLLDRAIQSGDWKLYENLLTQQYGRVGTWLFQLRLRGIATDLESFLFPLSGPLIRRASVTVVHSRYAAEMARLEYPSAQLQVIPHHSGEPPKIFVRSLQDIRSELGLGPKTLLVGAFGYVTTPKLGNVLVEAFAKFLDKGADAYLIFVGDDRQAENVKRLVRETKVQDRVRFMGYASRDHFYAFLNATDVVVALRYPSAGETSGTLSRSLALSRCLIVPEYASFTDIPADACVSIPVYGDMVTALVRALRRLYENLPLRRQLQSSAHRYAEEISPEACALRYLRATELASHGLGNSLRFGH